MRADGAAPGLHPGRGPGAAGGRYPAKGTGTPDLTVVVDGPRLWSINEERRLHWSERAALTQEWRWMAKMAARCAGSIEWAEDAFPLDVQPVLTFTRNARRDAHNYAGCGALKAVIDGFTDAGIWPDDTPAYMRCSEPELVVERAVKPRIVVNVYRRKS